jgi:hypothetical protein
VVRVCEHYIETSQPEQYRPSTNWKPETSRVVLVEGRDDSGFILSFWQHLANEQKITQDVDIFQTGGCGNLYKTLNILRLDTKVKTLAIIFDKDNNDNQSFQDITRAIKKRMLTPPSVTRVFEPAGNGQQLGIYLMADQTDCGALEHLVLESYSADTLTCTQAFFDCIPANCEAKQTDNKRKKLLARSYFLPFDITSLGQAAKTPGLIDFNNACFEPLRQFLIDFSKL